MTKHELIEALNDMGVSPHSYSLNNGPLQEGITIEKTTNHYGNNKEYTVWNVFYYDRKRSIENSHNTESDALIDIFERFKKYKQYYR